MPTSVATSSHLPLFHVVGFSGHRQLRDAAAAAGAIRGALAGAGRGGRRRCDLQFRAHAGELQVVVACDGGPGWRATRPLP